MCFEENLVKKVNEFPLRHLLQTKHRMHFKFQQLKHSKSKPLFWLCIATNFRTLKIKNTETIIYLREHCSRLFLSLFSYAHGPAD